MDSQLYYNPYSGQTFFSFFYVMAQRLWGFISGNLDADQVAADEVQMLVLSGVAAASALVGVFLVLRRITMLANSLSHTILLGIVMAFIWTYGMGSHVRGYAGQIGIHVLLAASLTMGLLTAFLTELLSKGARLQEDASTGIVFTSLFALGVIAVTLLTRNSHIGTEAVMGNVDALQLSDCKLAYTVLGINAVVFLLFFKEFQITTFDPGLSRSFGISPTLFGYLLMVLVSFTSIAAFRAVGVLMVLAFIVGPPLTARLLTGDLKKMLFGAVGIGVLASVLGVAISRHVLTVYGMALSTAGVIVCTIILLYALAGLYAKRHTYLHFANK